MPLFTRLKPNTYSDSVRLMKISESIEEIEGVSEGTVGMGTDSNKSLLEEKDLLSDELRGADPGDMMIAVRADDEQTAKKAFETIEETVRGSESSTGSDTGERRAPATFERALDRQKGSNLALISIPGEYAHIEAQKALNRDMDVLLFSDNVSVDREVQLKKDARKRDLLLMGPDAGTSMINGIPLGFANDVQSGSVGLVSASGTGLQEISSLIHRGGAGITQGIGVGGRDLSGEVGGLMMLQGLDYLTDDPETDVIVLISKPPSEDVAERIVERAEEVPEPVIVNFLGLSETRDSDSLRFARTLQDAAELALTETLGETFSFDDERFEEKIDEIKSKISERSEKQKYIRGLFAGGTLCSEAELLLSEKLDDVYSNVTHEQSRKLDDPWESQKHSVVDLGSDAFTQGRAHPMIDPGIRQDRLLEESEDPETAVLLMDIPIGYGAHDDPAGALAPGIREARDRVSNNGGELVVLAHVCGTDRDPQDLKKQEELLQDAGAVVFETNAQAARAAVSLFQQL
ncbi:MAG: acyl-CoA synthetase FdrA [bacterium]